MGEKTRGSSPVEGSLESATEEQLAQILQDLGARRDALRGELGRLDRSMEEVEVELARRGAGG